MTTRKSKKNKVKSETISNGGFTFTHANYNNYCIESKLIDKKTYRFSLLELEKLYDKALKLNKLPRLILGMKKDNGYILSVDCIISLTRNNMTKKKK